MFIILLCTIKDTLLQNFNEIHHLPFEIFKLLYFYLYILIYTFYSGHFRQQMRLV